MDETSARPRSLSGAYLWQAVDAIDAAGNPGALFGDRRFSRDHGDVAAAVMFMDAKRRRHDFLRTATLFSALAAEAYVNELFAARVKARRLRDKLDRMSTVKKYRFAVWWITDEDRLPRGGETLKVIEELFSLRHKLVHPKPGFGPSELRESEGEFEALFAPSRVVRFVIMVAGYAVVLVRRAYGPTTLDMPADFVWFGRQALIAYARRSEIMPRPLAKAERPLLSQALDAVGRETAT